MSENLYATTFVSSNVNIYAEQKHEKIVAKFIGKF